MWIRDINETVVFLHVLAAFAVGAIAVIYVAVAVGAPAPSGR